MGVAFGIFVYVAEFYFAAQGLNTKKRWKAIATIAMAIISIIIFILKLAEIMK